MRGRWVLGIVGLGLSLASCATNQVNHVAAPRPALPTLQGSYHQVQSGETLWRIAHTYGLNPHTLAAANRLPSVSALTVGQQLFIPLPIESKQFLWPVRGMSHPSNVSRGVEIRATAGNLVRASRSGRVAVATQQLSGWGKTVVLDHLDGYVTIYAGLSQILVTPGMDLRQGTPLGSLQAQALHFEIRYGANPKNTIALLPRE